MTVAQGARVVLLRDTTSNDGQPVYAGTVGRVYGFRGQNALVDVNEEDESILVELPESQVREVRTDAASRKGPRMDRR